MKASSFIRAALLLLAAAAQVSPRVDELQWQPRVAGLAARLSPGALQAARLRGGVSTRSTRAARDERAAAPGAARSRARGRSRGRARGRGRRAASRPRAGGGDSDPEAGPSPGSRDTQESLLDADAAHAVAALAITPSVDTSRQTGEPAEAPPGPTHAAGGLGPQIALLEAEVRAALLALAIKEDPVGRSDRENDGDNGGGGASGEGWSGGAALEVVVSEAAPEMVKAVETATNVRNFADNERRARVIVREGVFSWRGVLPVSAFQGKGTGEYVPVETLLHFSGPHSSIPAGRVAHAEPGNRVEEDLPWGSEGRAQLCGSWLLAHKSLGGFRHLSLRSSGAPKEPDIAHKKSPVFPPSPSKRSANTGAAQRRQLLPSTWAPMKTVPSILTRTVKGKAKTQRGGFGGDSVGASGRGWSIGGCCRWGLEWRAGHG